MRIDERLEWIKFSVFPPHTHSISSIKNLYVFLRIKIANTHTQTHIDVITFSQSLNLIDLRVNTCVFLSTIIYTKPLIMIHDY